MEMTDRATSRAVETLRLEAVIGLLSQPEIADAVHDVSHHGTVEYIDLSGDDMRRHRLRVATDRGTDCAISLPRHVSLENGAVVLLEKTRAIVVRMQAREWLRLAPVDAAAALEIGYFAGNMHWQVRFAGDLLLVELQGPLARYLERLDFLISARRVRVVQEKP